MTEQTPQWERLEQDDRQPVACDVSGSSQEGYWWRKRATGETVWRCGDHAAMLPERTGLKVDTGGEGAKR